MSLANQQITFYHPPDVSQAINEGVRAVADSYNGSIRKANQHCIDRVPYLTEGQLNKLKSKQPPRYNRDGQTFVTLIWVLLVDGLLEHRTTGREWLIDLFNATDLIGDEITDENWGQVIQLFQSNVEYEAGMATPSAEDIAQKLSRLHVGQRDIADTIQRHIPIKPPNFVGRSDNMNEIKTRLGVIDKSTRQPLTIIRGWPGVGKTALVNALVHDKSVEQAFTDGILWAILGHQNDIRATLKSWAEQLGARHLLKLSELDDLIEGLRAVLAGRDILIVADDVWTESDGNVIKHLVDQHSNTLLIATRFTDLAGDLRNHKDDEYVLQPLSESHSVELLTILAPDVAITHADRFPMLAQAVENLPLALCVAGPLLQHYHEWGVSVVRLFNEFEADFNHNLLEYKAPADRFDEKTGRTPTIELLFRRSVETLAPSNQMAFAYLGVFEHKPATFNFEAIEAVWESHMIIDHLIAIIGRGLLEPVSEQRYHMHRTLHIYANKLIDNYDKTGGLF